MTFIVLSRMRRKKVSKNYYSNDCIVVFSTSNSKSSNFNLPASYVLWWHKQVEVKIVLVLINNYYMIKH